MLLVAFLATWPCSEGMSGLNPCHRGRSAATVAASSCDSIVIPPRMCRRCKIRAIGPNGQFPNCENIYDLDETCLSGIQEYVDLNECDDKRRDQINNQTPFNLRMLDFFVYSVCEECCDCIPFGARPEEYLERKAKGGDYLISLTRGNCPVHARFDICAIWPQAKDIVLPGIEPKLDRDPICPIIESWFQSPASQNWLTTNVTIPRRIERYLKKFNRIARCRNRQVWEECAALEFAQNRI